MKLRLLREKEAGIAVANEPSTRVLQQCAKKRQGDSASDRYGGNKCREAPARFKGLACRGTVESFEGQKRDGRERGDNQGEERTLQQHDEVQPQRRRE